jgi:hypothetical protein
VHINDMQLRAAATARKKWTPLAVNDNFAGQNYRFFL